MTSMLELEEGAIGSENVGKCNSTGLLLLRKCAEHDLLITNTIFRLPNRNKTSWMDASPIQTLASHRLYRTDRQDVRVSKTMCGALDRPQIGCQPKNSVCSATSRPESSYETGYLKAKSMRKAFINDICNYLGAMNRRPRRELDSFSKCGSFFCCNYLSKSISQTPKLV